MQRRTVLRGLVALATGASAGCTGANREVPATAPDPPPAVRTAGRDDPDPAGGDGGSAGGGTPDRQRFVVPARSFRADDDGDLVVVLTVANRAKLPHEAVVTVAVAAGDKAFAPSRYVALGPGEKQQLRVRVPVAYEAFQASPGFDVRFDPGRPATPIPTGTVTPYPEDRETKRDGGPTGTGGRDASDGTAAESTASPSPSDT
jgi:hypothetical protein